MQNVLCFVHRAANGLQVSDAAFNEGNFVADVGEVFFLAGREIVENDYAFSAAHQFINSVGTDKARATGDDVSHSSNPPCAFHIPPHCG